MPCLVFSFKPFRTELQWWLCISIWNCIRVELSRPGEGIKVSAKSSDTGHCLSPSQTSYPFYVASWSRAFKLILMGWSLATHSLHPCIAPVSAYTSNTGLSKSWDHSVQHLGNTMFTVYCWHLQLPGPGNSDPGTDWRRHIRGRCLILPFVLPAV